MEKFKQLTEDELQKVIGGVNWASYGECLLTNGASDIPALA